MKTNKMISLLIVSLLVLSTGFVVFNTVDTVKAGWYWQDGLGNIDARLSNTGEGNWQNGLTCGEIITLQIVNNSLDPNERYKVGVWTGDEWVALHTDSGGRADKHGDLSISFHVPGWTELGKDPVNKNGTGALVAPWNISGLWNISLWNHNFDEQIFKGENHNLSILISNHYDVFFTRESTDSYSERITHLIHGSENENFYVNVRNWTGTSFETKYNAPKGVGIWDLRVWNPKDDYIQGFPKLNLKANNQLVVLSTYESNLPASPDKHRDYFYWVLVENNQSNDLSSLVPMPVKLNISATYPTNAKWGDTININGVLKNANGTGLGGYTVKLFAPVDGGYAEARTDTTLGNGAFGWSIQTGSLKGLSAGTWHIGTYYDDDTTEPLRLDETNQAPWIPGFISYYSFEVGTKDAATVSIHNTDDIISGFKQTINVSVSNASWMDDHEFRDMMIHLTGAEVNFSGVRYEKDDVILVNWTGGTTGNKDRSYYEFNVTFTKTGTAKIMVSHPGDQTAIAKNIARGIEGIKGMYNPAYYNENLKPNITGQLTFSVVSSGPMNVIIEDAPEKVGIDKNVPGCADAKVNETGLITTIKVFGDEQSKPKNATITVTGAGLDFTIPEDKDTHEFLAGKKTDGDESTYQVYINPKQGGTLTITVTNATGGQTVTKDYAIKGLTGSVTTSVGDDLEIEVGTTETIMLSGVPENVITTITFFSGIEDNYWDCLRVLNESSEFGELSFTPDYEDIDQIGYIVVVVDGGWERFMYEIIEVVPIDDLTVEIISPEEGNRTLTVGLENEITVKITDPEGNPVTDDDPDLEITLYDIDGDEVTIKENDISWSSIGDGEWEITIIPYFAGQLEIAGVNATEAIKHIGRTMMDVDHATITFSPAGATAGIGVENLTVEVFAVDANGNPISETLYLWDTEEEALYMADGVSLTDGEGEFDIDEVGDNKTTIVGVWVQNDPEDGNATDGEFDIDFPMFTLNPATIYLNQENLVEVIAKNAEGEPIEDIYLTFYGFATNPEPVLTDEDGFAAFSITPLASGKYNVSIIKELVWDNNRLDWDEMWDNAVITDTVLTATSYRLMDISAPASVNEEEQFTVTLTRRGTTSPVSGALVTFNSETKTSNADGTVTFTAPSVRANLNYHITARATGYVDATATILVINLPQIYISVPDEDVVAGEKFEVVAGGDDGNNVGIQVTFQGETKTTSATGTVTFTAPTEEGTYTVTATKEGYLGAEPAEVKVVSAGIPGFEVLTLIAALGIAFILLKRRRN
jgi:hypothetical protein